MRHARFVQLCLKGLSLCRCRNSAKCQQCNKGQGRKDPFLSLVDRLLSVFGAGLLCKSLAWAQVSVVGGAGLLLPANCAPEVKRATMFCNNCDLRLNLIGAFEIDHHPVAGFSKALRVWRIG